MSENTRGQRVPLGFSCRYCGSADTWVEDRFEPSPLNTYSLAGVQDKLSGRFHPYAVCDGLWARLTRTGGDRR